METPWGQADSAEILAPGITSYSTPSHGGIHLSLVRQAQLPEGIDNFLHDLEWWEEDCDWAIPYIVFQYDIEKHGAEAHFAETLEAAYSTVKHYHSSIKL